MPDHSSPLPACGIGLRAEHYRDFLAQRPALPLVEVHSENCFGGGRHLEVLMQVRQHTPVSLHGVGLSLGSTDALSLRHVAALKSLAERVQPALVSEHLSFSSQAGVFSNDLLPLPRTREALAHVVRRVVQVQEALGRQILVENVSAYLAWRDDEMSEAELLAELARRSGCGLLLDINNLYVNQRNHGADALAALRALPPDAVQQMHLAGHVVNRVPVAGEPGDEAVELLVDSHSQPVCAEVWQLYRQALALIGPRPTIIEWDADLPPLQGLLDEAARADVCMAASQEDSHACAA